MNRILLLYPRAWRRRYLDEVADLLADRPPTVRDQLDLVLGAVDAWLHPQVSAPAAVVDEEPLMGPSVGLALGFLAGLMWAVGGIAQHTGGYDPITGYKASSGLMLVLAATMVSALAAVARTWSMVAPGRATRAAALTMLGSAFLVFLPWPILVLGYWGHLLATMLFGLRLHEAGRRSGVLLVVAALAAVTFNTESAFALATVPLGVAWLAVSLGGVRARIVAPAAGR
jgi:hypothetical protein